MVLTAPRPSLAPRDAPSIAGAVFGFAASSARDLGSERDLTVALLDAGGQAVGILKVSNPAEDAEVLDMEAAAALHVFAVDPGLRVALPWRVAATGRPGPAEPGDALDALRGRWVHAGIEHWVRLYDVLPGNSRIAAEQLPDAALTAWGETTARLGQALRGFTHARAQRTMLWDIQHALSTRAMVDEIRDPEARAAVERVLDVFERRVAPVWPRLRAQPLHTDLTVDNVLTDEAGLITGIVDFGDMSHTALITDLASVLDSLGVGREGAELLRVARLILDGYQRWVELEAVELEILAIAWATRSAVTIAISSWRVARGLEDREFAERCNAGCLEMIHTLEGIGWDAVARQLGAPAGRRADASLAERREKAFGPVVDPLFYDEPIQVRDAQGVSITDVTGRTYLDAYNNVPCVGHGHPRVTAAIAHQSRQINTHTRYLHPLAIELAERLKETCPPELDTVLLVNSGSEANDVAWRIATAVTGHAGGLCTAFAYHGMTEATAALSPEGWLDGQRPGHIETWEAPDSYRGTHLDASGFADALTRMTSRGLAPAATILDGVLTSDGIVDLDAAYVRGLVELTREAGGLWIADEVQAGHGRTGDALWSFQRFGIVPDFVTLGKPMGNGHPVAAVITRRQIVSQLAGRATLFSTFGGNPVSAAAAIAVLDVIDDERVLERVQRVGRRLGAALRELMAGHSEIGDVRGVGLVWGVEITADRVTREPDAARARHVRDRMRHLGVLVGTTGRYGNVLKIRPPLALEEADVTVIAAALHQALADPTG